MKWCLTDDSGVIGGFLRFVEEQAANLLATNVPPSVKQIMEFRQTLVDSFLRALNAQAGGIAYVESTEEDFEAILSVGYGDESEFWDKVFFGQGIVSAAARQGDVIFTPHVRDDNRYVELHSETESQLTIPLCDRKGVFAVLAAEWENPRDIPKNVRELGEDISSRLSCLLESFRADFLGGRLQRVFDLVTEISRESKDEKRLDRIMAATAAISGGGEIALLQRFGGRLIVTHTRNIYVPTPDDLEIGVADGIGYTCYVAHTQEPYYVKDTSDINRYPKYRPVVETTLSQYTVPLVFRKELVGVLNVGATVPYAFSRVDRHMLDIFAKHAGSILYHTRIIEDLRTLTHTVNQNLKFVGFVRPTVEAQPEGQAKAEMLRLCDAAEEAREWISSVVGPMRPAEEAPTSPCSLVDAALSDMETIFRSLEIQVTTTFKVPAEHTIPLFADHIRSVVDNLLWNAVDSFKEEQDDKRIQVLVEPRKLFDTSYLAIFITDSGRGLPTSNTEELFKPNFKWRIRRGDQGLGFGLWICDRLLARHGGYLVVEQIPGGGTKAEMWIRIWGEV
ncbi:Adaptive-response sensory-kinase SasA [subsurface metagenome]